MKKIYLAGPDVFLENAETAGDRLKEKCKKYGFIGLYPLDNKASSKSDIVFGNMKLIDECDIVLANCNVFRGKEMDSGTAFEIGYAAAKGKQILCYCADLRPQKDKFGEKNGRYITEDFGEPLNIMITENAKVFHSATDALAYAANCEKEQSKKIKFKESSDELIDKLITWSIFMSAVSKEGLELICDVENNTISITDPKSEILTYFLQDRHCKNLYEVNRYIDVYHSALADVNPLYDTLLHSEFMQSVLKQIDARQSLSFYNVAGNYLVNIPTEIVENWVRKVLDKVTLEKDNTDAA